MWNLFTASSDHVLGVERYGNRVFSHQSLDKSLFEQERFFTIQQGDTFYNNLVEFNPYYEKAKLLYENAKYVGDKIPLLYTQFSQLHDNIPDAVVVFLFRNIIEVSSSYKARSADLEDIHWSSNKGVETAIREWAMSIRAYNHWKNKISIVPICYEDFFFDPASLQRLSQVINIEYPAVIKRHQQLLKLSKSLQEGRRVTLSSEEMFKISMTAPFGAFRNIIEEARA